MILIHKKGDRTVCKNYRGIALIKIWLTMTAFDIPSKLIRITRACVEGSRCRIKIGDDLSDVFQVTGLKQGGALSPTLFNMVLKKGERNENRNSAVRGLWIKPAVSIRRRYRRDGLSVIKAKELFYKIEKEAACTGLKVNEAKTKYMHVSRPGRARLGQNVTMDTYNFKHVKQFKYLVHNHI